MVTAPLEAAARIGDALAAASIRSDGGCTWLVDERVAAEGRWKLRARTLEPGLATGTAGVAWLLARLACALDDDSLATLAVDALRSALGAPGGPNGFHEGRLGAVWAALDAGIALENDELLTRGSAALEPATEARPSTSPTLYGGDAGVMHGLLALEAIGGDGRLTEVAARFRDGLVRIVGELTVRALRGGTPWSSAGRSFVGAATGASGLAIPLLAYSHLTGNTSALQAAEDAALAERAWFTAGAWIGTAFHPWAPQETRAASWCSGAVGIGQARLLAYRTTGELRALADVAAAVEVVRATIAAPHPADASLCHGLAGWIDFLVSAGVGLDADAHIAAAQRVGERLVAGAGAVAEEAQTSPSLLLGAAGVALALLRLHDPGIPNPLDAGILVPDPSGHEGNGVGRGPSAGRAS
jgi:lantibiotic modifying enzyme